MEEQSNNKKVMVAIDESECSFYALDWILKNLRDTVENSTLVIFSIQPNSDFAYLSASTFGVAPPDLVKSVQENRKKMADALLEKAKDICIKAGVTPETITEVGDPKEAICAAVEKLSIQLLVLGSHNRKALERAFLGSVSNYCVHNAKCPVLVVRKTQRGNHKASVKLLIVFFLDVYLLSFLDLFSLMSSFLFVQLFVSIFLATMISRSSILIRPLADVLAYKSFMVWDVCVILLL